jgi:Protein of unknown function (DUF551)
MNAEWQPIETATRSSKNGQILTFRDDRPTVYMGGGPWFQTSFWSETHNAWVGWPKDTQPTHWMPLPKAPTK